MGCCYVDYDSPFVLGFAMGIGGFSTGETFTGGVLTLTYTLVKLSPILVRACVCPTLVFRVHTNLGL